jgi:predicted ArsR family transcriptional regulator
MIQVMVKIMLHLVQPQQHQPHAKLLNGRHAPLGRKTQERTRRVQEKQGNKQLHLAAEQLEEVVDRQVFRLFLHQPEQEPAEQLRHEALEQEPEQQDAQAPEQVFDGIVQDVLLEELLEIHSGYWVLGY